MKFFEKLMILLLLIGMAACGHLGSRVIPEPAKPGDYNAKRVVRVAVLASTSTWERSPYYRTGDIGWPPQVVVAQDGTVCPLWHIVVDEPSPNDFFACPTQWRFARP